MERAGKEVTWIWSDDKGSCMEDLVDGGGPGGRVKLTGACS